MRYKYPGDAKKLSFLHRPDVFCGWTFFTSPNIYGRTTGSISGSETVGTSVTIRPSSNGLVL